MTKLPDSFSHLKSFFHGSGVKHDFLTEGTSCSEPFLASVEIKHVEESDVITFNNSSFFLGS